MGHQMRVQSMKPILYVEKHPALRPNTKVKWAINRMHEISGIPKWLCKNVLLWRLNHGLSIEIGKVIA
jgi:hypothetical protein